MRPVDARVAVLASGEGTNLQALLDDPTVGRWIALVVSDRSGARALDRARERGVDAVHLPPTRDDEELVALLRDRSIEVVVLAGFMKVLGPAVIDAYRGRILNVHPSLLPAFPGSASVADALAWGVKVTGVTVHLVDEEVDHGPIVAQEALPVASGDDWGSLEARVHAVEHRLLPEAVRALVEGRITVTGRTVRVSERQRS